MAVINNTLSEINDVIIFETTMVSNIISITSLTDGTIGETADRFFIKEFQYTVDAIHFSDFQPLSLTALQAIEIDPTYDFQLRYRYTRGGSDASGILQFDWINIETTIRVLSQTQTFKDSIFSFFTKSECQPDTTDWCTNVLNKLYEPGIVSKKMIRGDNQNQNQEDRDYIDFWRTVSCFFEMQVDYIRRFEQFDQDVRLLRFYLINRGLIVDRSATIDQMIDLLHSFYNQMSQRGTLNIVSENETSNGELLRAIEYQSECDEFLFAPNNPNTIGWTVNVNSPLNKYIHSNPWLIKLFDKQTASQIPLISDSNVELIDLDGFDNVFQISGVTDGNFAGIGLDQFSTKFTTKIDPTLAYELVFWAKGDGLISATVQGFDSEQQEVNPTLISQGVQNIFAIKSRKLANPNTWHKVRVIVFESGIAVSSNPEIQTTNIGVGRNLKWRDTICKAGIKILLDRSNQGINNAPTATNKTRIINNDQSITLQLSDIVCDYDDIEGDPFASIDITAFSGPGQLQLLEIPIVNFPITISSQQISDGQLSYQDEGSINESKNVTIDYTINDLTSTGSDEDILYIRDIEFKPLKTSYGKGLVSSPLMIESWLRNRSDKDNDQVDTIVRQYLIPHNVAWIGNYISQKIPLAIIGTPIGLYEERYEELYQ